MSDKILVVDDEPEITDIICLYLENEGFTIFKAHTAVDALKYITEEKLDMAILDIMLPDMNGLEICKRIREKYHYPIIMLTARGQPASWVIF